MDAVASLRAENEDLRQQVAALRERLKQREAQPTVPETVGWSCGHCLNPEQVQRYSRHLILPNIGVQGQSRLCEASVLVVGAGGLGSSAALYLACAGVGRLGIVDKDVVQLDNLHRQIIHRESTVGIHKAVSAAMACRERNSSIQVDVHTEGLTPATALPLVQNYDVVVDASDNVPTRYLVSDACVITKTPLVSGAAIGTEGQLTVYAYGMDGPCYRCLFPKAPAPGHCTRCSDNGVLGPVPGVIGVLEAMETVKIIAQVGDVLSRRLLIMDFLCARFHTVKLRAKVPTCEACGDSPSVTLSTLERYDYSAFTGQTFDDSPIVCSTSLPASARLPPVEVNEVINRSKEEGQELLLVDVRPQGEFDIGHLNGALNFPYDQLDADFPKLLSKCCTGVASLGAVDGGAIDASDRQSDGGGVVVVCRRGNDSQLVVQKLRSAGISARDMVGGLAGWAEVDPTFPQY